jgi:uncharacterized ferredoxin-like protein
VPVSELAKRIDSNIVNFERAKRELPSAELSITLPIMLIGVSADAGTPAVDVSACKFTSVSAITGKNKSENRWRIVNGYLCGTPMQQIGPESGSQPMIGGADSAELEAET